MEKALMEYVVKVIQVSCPKVRYQELLPLFLEVMESDDAVVASA